MNYGIFSDGSRNLIASAEQLEENGWQEGEYSIVSGSTICADSWIAADNIYKNEEELESSFYYNEDMTPLDYWVELHGTPDGFFEQFSDVEVQQ